MMEDPVYLSQLKENNSILNNQSNIVNGAGSNLFIEPFANYKMVNSIIN